MIYFLSITTWIERERTDSASLAWVSLHVKLPFRGIFLSEKTSIFLYMRQLIQFLKSIVFNKT